MTNLHENPEGGSQKRFNSIEIKYLLENLRQFLSTEDPSQEQYLQARNFAEQTKQKVVGHCENPGSEDELDAALSALDIWIGNHGSKFAN